MMNWERGLRRAVIVLSIPIFLAGAIIAVYSFIEMKIVDRELTTGINAYLDVKDDKSMKLEKDYASIGAIPVSAKKRGLGPWENYAPEPGKWQDLSNQISSNKSTALLGLIVISVGIFLWAIFYAGVWIAKGFHK